MKKTYTATLIKDGATCMVPVPFDPKLVFGKVRAPVVVTLNGYTYRSTIASMGGCVGIPLRKSHREAAELEGTETLSITLAADAAPRVVEPPKDLVRALKANKLAWAAWQQLSFTHQREHVEAIDGAKAAATRARRIANAVKLCATK